MGTTAEGQDAGNPTNVYDGATAAPGVDGKSDLDFAAQGRTAGPLPKSSGPHAAKYVLGPVPD